MELKKFAEVLSESKFMQNDTEVCKYALLSVSDSMVYALDMEDYKAYGFNYAIVEEDESQKIVVDMDSKAEMSLSATDKITEEGFAEFSIADAITNIVDSVKTKIYSSEVPAKIDECTSLLKQEYEKDYAEIASKFESLTTQFNIVNAELEKYKEKESVEMAKQHKADIDALFEQYAPKLNKCAEFLVYKAKVDAADVTTDEVNQKLTLMLGKYMMETSKKQNFSYNPSEAGVSNTAENEITKRYGHLLDKFMK